jgi:hypothetical protein
MAIEKSNPNTSIRAAKLRYMVLEIPHQNSQHILKGFPGVTKKKMDGEIMFFQNKKKRIRIW